MSRAAFLCGVVASAMLALAESASAQLSFPIPSRDIGPAVTAKASASSDPATRLAEIRAMLKRLEQPHGMNEGSPPGTPDPEIGDRMRLLHQLERPLAQRVDSQERHAHVVQARRDAEARADNWRGFADPPPYPLPFVDSLAQAHGSRHRCIRNLRLLQID